MAKEPHSMTVAALIERLLRLPADAEVWLECDDVEWHPILSVRAENQPDAADTGDMPHNPDEPDEYDAAGVLVKYGRQGSLVEPAAPAVDVILANI